MNCEAKRAQRAAALRALLDGVTRVGARPELRPLPPSPAPPSARVSGPRLELVPRWVVEDPDSAVTHVHSDEQANRAKLHRPCPPGMPLDLWLDLLAEED